MTTVAVLMAPTHNGWGVYLTSGEQLAGFRGIGSKTRAIRYLRLYTRGASGRARRER